MQGRQQTMANRVKRMPIESLPGAKKNGVQWLMCCGVRSTADAQNVAAAFLCDLEKVKNMKADPSPTKDAPEKK